MIYVIKIYGPNNETSIKIGYTKDKNFNKRMRDYKTHNPFYELLYTIPNCTEDDENKLHYYFEKYKYDYGDEWFYYEDEIIEFFDTHKTKESIDELGLDKKPKPGRPKADSTLFKEELAKLGLDKKPKRPKFKADSTLFREELAKWLKDNESTLSDIVQKVLKSFLNRKGFYYIMKFICENVYFNRDEKVSEDDKELILSKLPLDYSKYLTTLGPERCKAKGYHKTKLKREFNNMFFVDFVKLKFKILSEFKVGERYLRSDIKEKLSVIYSSLSYTKTPKANDLEDYFDIKSCLYQKMERRVMVLKY